MPGQNPTILIMKNFFNSAIPYVIGLFLLFVTFQSLKLHFEDQKTITRLTENLAISQKECTYFKTRNGEQAVKIQSQELTIKEIRSIYPAAIADMKNLYIQPRQLKSFVQSNTKAEKHIQTTLRDSSIIDVLKKIETPVKVIDYRDKWFTVRGLIIGNDTEMDIAAIDTLNVAGYMSRRPHPWLWIFGGKRHPEAAITNKNPFIKYSITKSITVKK